MESFIAEFNSIYAQYQPFDIFGCGLTLGISIILAFVGVYILYRLSCFLFNLLDKYLINNHLPKGSDQ